MNGAALSVQAGVREPSLTVRGGRRLCGTVTVDGSKNAALPMLAAAAVFGAPVAVAGVPACTDVDVLLDLLAGCGAAVSRCADRGAVRIEAVQATGRQSDVTMAAAAIRGSYYLVPALIAAHGQAVLPWPGGCAVGYRGMELHFAVYSAFGDKVIVHGDGYTVRRGRSPSHTVQVELPYRSRVATGAALLRALVAGCSVAIGNPNLSVEVHALCAALTAAGCQLSVETHRMLLKPTRVRSGARWRVPGDKIEAGVLVCAIAATGGHGRVGGVAFADLAPLADALVPLGFTVIPDGDTGVLVAGPKGRTGSGVLALASLAPGGLDADWEPGLMAVALGRPGAHRFADAINPARHGNLIGQLRRLGAVVTETSTTEAHLTGPQSLTGATVRATDIRTGSALLIAALTAAGTTGLTGLSQLRRGYADLPAKMRALGADIDVP